MDVLAKHEQRYLKKRIGDPPGSCEDAAEWRKRTGKKPAKRFYHYTAIRKGGRLSIFASPKEVSRITNFPGIDPKNEHDLLIWRL